MRAFFPALAFFLLCGCRTPPEPSEPVVDPRSTMLFLQAGLRPEKPLFPEYLLLEGIELEQHGRIPTTSLIGAGMKTDLNLSDVRSAFMHQLAPKGWRIGDMEVGRHFFRFEAALDGRFLEIRAVQGSGQTHVFLLYKPLADPLSQPAEKSRQTIATFGMPGGSELLLVLFVVLLLFGAKKLPELSRSLGRSLGEFKKGKEDLERELRDIERKSREVSDPVEEPPTSGNEPAQPDRS